MVFSSLVFLLIFLPCTLFIYYTVPKIFKNGFLLFASLLFFSWAGVSYSILIILSILVNFFTGKLLNTRWKKHFLITALIYNLGMLIVFKYTNFIVANLNEALSFLSVKQIPQTSIILPIGISFYTFQAMSYLFDVYYGHTSIQKRIDNLALYISLFPQLIAGPIVRYHEIKDQLTDRSHHVELFSKGIERFIIGLGKKVLIANTLALVVDQIFSTPVNTLDTLTAWIGIMMYALQIYFDFSGYTDMALGLGGMFGFRLPENFNFPYISRSIREFWKRWHITLSNWFRDYLYIPLGGNRKGKARTYINLVIVFMVTGFWHGASWNFLIWGLFHGIFLLLERSEINFLPAQRWKSLRHLYTLIVVLFAWVFFRSDNLIHAYHYCLSMIGIINLQPSTGIPLIFKFFNLKILITFVFGILASTPIFKLIWKNVRKIVSDENMHFKYVIHETMDYFKIVALMLILILCTMELAVGTYNPFIYFRF